MPGAFQTQGGQWRVKGESPARIASRCDVAGFARRRRPPKHLREARLAFSRMSNLVERPAHRALMRAVESIDLPENALGELGLMRDQLGDLADSPPSRKAFEAIKTAALASWILKAIGRGGRPGKIAVLREANLAPNLGRNRPLSRRSFERHFGQHYPAAMRVVSLASPAADAAPGFFSEGGDMVAGDFHPASTPEEVRRFVGAAQKKSTIHVDPVAKFATRRR